MCGEWGDLGTLAENLLTARRYRLPHLFTSWSDLGDYISRKQLRIQSFFEKQKNSWNPTFIGLVQRQLRLVLSIEDKEYYLEHPIPVAPVAPPGQQIPPEDLAAHAAWVKGQKEVVELKAMFSKQAEQELLQTVREFHTCKQEEGQSVSSHVLKMKGYIDNLERLGQPNFNMHGMGKTVNELHAMLKLHEESLPKKDVNPALHAIRAGRKQRWAMLKTVPFAPKPKTPPPPKKDNPAKDAICHQCGEVGHWRRNCPVYLTELMKKKKLSQGASASGIFTIELYSFPSKSWIYDTGCGTHICITTQGLRGSRKLKPGALSLYVGDGHRAAVEAIGTYHLELPSGLVIVLNNCHYAPSITRGVISVSRLFDDGFINRFDDNNVISVSKDNLVYFMAVPRDGIFEIDMSCSNTNDSSMYAITNKRAKINLDSSLLWHCRLGHISKKRIEKLQHDGLINSIDIESLGKCVSCLSGKMARKPYSHQVERAKDLLGLIHTDVFQKEVENQLGKTIKSLRSDRGGEYMSQEFLDHLKEHGIIAHRTPPLTRSKTMECQRRRNRTLAYGPWFRSMIESITPTNVLLDYSLESAARILKHGYPKETMGYSFYSPSENKVFVARNAEFFEFSSGTLKQVGVSTRTRRPTDRLCLYIDTEEHELGDLGEPANYRAALLDPESKKWLDAMNVEMQSMKDNDVWVLVELPPNARTVGSKWLFKKKTDMDGAVYIFKARLVAKGFTQTYGVDYEETFSPVADIRAIRILIAIAAYYDYEIWQMDVKTAFLNGHLSEEVYMEQPEGFVNPKYPNHVCKLKRSIYGLKQASRQWNKRFDDEIKKFSFTQNRDEPCVYLKASGSYVAILILYVDDILLMGNNIPMLQDVKSYLGRSFAMKDLGDAAYILGIKIYRDRSKRLIGLNQSAYIEKILKRFYMENSKRGTIPMQEKLKLSKSQGASTPAEKQRMQNIPYASAVGSIMYAVRCTRPDVAFAQNMTSRFQQNPGEEHWTAVKNILKYLRNTKDMFLVYGGNMERELRVSCYTDAGYLTDADNLKSQTGYVFVLNGGAVDWKSTKQSIFATSSTDAEYIAAFDASKEAVWIRKFISGLGIVPTIEEPISMYCDNTGAIAIAKDDGVTKGARHFRAKVHYLRETIKLGDVKIEKIDTDDNLADPFTKALAFPKHSELTRNIGLLPASSFM
ncbi:retrotransposon protein, putative, ty1-copia subclass [Tanacetum coccineum]